MIRKAFVMQVNPGAHAEYQRRHDPIWPELAQVLKAHGAHHYSIFLDETRHLLFGVVDIESQAQWDAVAQTEICQRWWRYMSELMPSNVDFSPVTTSLREVFYLK
ncbi:L-rhamnose mutarotase [Serratia odorifera]|uniref:L-rhamnose mutarotase n=1 Tax=Serratia odorifera TaxID=618 RepID=UPI00235F1699|nr:L-rhamnose mutarotase [Serratia odorifera]